jgi:mannose-1-phosphate guanylyltransferase
LALPRLWPVVIAGGAGTRFWPASRRARPKPFVPLVGDASLIDTTIARMRRLAPAGRIALLGSVELAPLLRSALRAQPGAHVLLEPEARNTAAAIAWAAAWVAGRDAEGAVGIFPADHHIPRVAPFVRAVTAALRAAADGEALVLIGVEPTRPDTAYGYLRLAPEPRDRRARGRAGALRVARFVEKPRRARARRMLADGGHLWNAGMVVARPRRVLDETRVHAPEVWDALGPLLERAARGERVEPRELARAFRRVRPISFDYAVLERSRRVRAVRGRFAWSDLGSWDALGEHLPEDSGNRARRPERVAALDAKGNVVWTQADKQVVLLGVDDLVIVETRDALLVASKDRAQDVRRAVDVLADRGRKDLV